MSKTIAERESQPEPNEPENGNGVAVTQDDEVLVAYLDGELPREERGVLEQRLVNDESLRIRMQSFQKEWDLLDLLPSPVTTEQSVRSTIELVVEDIRRYVDSPTLASRDSSNGNSTTISAGLGSPSAATTATASTRNPKKTPSRMPLKGWLVPIVPILAFAIVFAGIRWGDFRNQQAQVRDFPVAIDMEVYSIAENTSLIEHLNASTRWRRVVAGTVIPSVEKLIKIEGEESLFAGKDLTVGFPSQTQLTERLNDFSTEERMIALSRLERFQQLDPKAQESLRASAQRLRQAPDAQDRLNTLRAYARWREQLSDELVDAIENETGEEREKAIERAIADTITSIGRATSRNLGNEAIERLDFTLIQIVKQRLASEAGSSNQSSPNPSILRLLKMRGDSREAPEKIYRMVAARIVFQDSKREVPPLTTAELELIQAMLPSKDAETLQRYVDDRWVRALILEDWAQEALRRKSRGQTTAPTLPEQYESLPAEQREVVDLMSPEKSRRWLMDHSP